MPAVIPQDAENPGFKYTSKNTKVATVNELGRIRAHKEGTAEIVVEASGVKKQFVLSVYEEIKVTEMDLGDYQKTMKVGEKQLLTPSVLPRRHRTGKLRINPPMKKLHRLMCLEGSKPILLGRPK